ncbi:hypothetical protein ACHHYP_12535 [Achlya hypogyna]|uniref:gamma-glutamylcyclotransferase n=1 Tax=Achlya hypogyna TaxID=1202772 RepID=A0A1V9YGW8_ACHHY|nr:hypothetical protein ACHHYP_12535 [Achlya hypogyna]
MSDDGSVWYFAIGSMMNPISLANRDLTPLESHPAKVLDFRLGFFGAAGMAEAVPEPGASFHGVLHKMTAAHMAVLDALEVAYVRVAATVERYDGTCVAATIYGRDAATVRAMQVPDAPPSERYIEVMVRGCENFGVAPAHIEYLKSVPFVPRKAPSAFLRLPEPEGLPTFSQEQLRAGAGVNGAPLLVSLNGKVCEYIGGPDFYLYKHFLKMAGQPVELRMSKMLQDPKYGCPDKLKDFTREHCGAIEDLILSSFGDKLKVVAHIDQEFAD